MSRKERAGRFIIGFLMFIAVAAAGEAAEVSPKNLLKNGGFEDGIIGWCEGQNGIIDVEVMHSGLKSIRLEGCRDKDLYVATGTTVSSDKHYRGSVYIKTENVLPKEAVFINVQPFSGGKPLSWYCQQPGVWKILRTGGTQDWTRYQFEVSGLKEGTDNVLVYLRIENGASGTVWFDDLELREEEGGEAVLSGETVDRRTFADVDGLSKTFSIQSSGGGKGDAEVVTENSRRFVRVKVDSTGGWVSYLGALNGRQRELLKNADSLRLHVRGNGDIALFLIEESGAVWMKSLCLRSPDAWRVVDIPLAEFGVGSWTKDKETDGVLTRDKIYRMDFTGGSKQFQIDIEKIEVAGNNIAGMDIVITGPLTIEVETNKPDTNVFFSDEPVKLKFVAGPLSKKKRRLTYRIKDFGGKVVQKDSIEVTGERFFTKEIVFAQDLLGWFRLEAELDTGETIAKKGSRGEGYVTFGILPPPTPEYLERDFDSPFGIPLQGDMCMPVGAKWVWGLVHWKHMEPEEGEFAYKSWEEWMISQLKECNLNAVHSFTNPPTWASTAPEGDPNARAYPPKEKAWANYIRAMCRFCKTHPIDEEKRVYQTLWEPMYPWGWKGTMEDIVRISRIAYETIKSEDPHSIVLGLCTSPLSAATIDWTREALELGAYNYFDALSIHAYIPGSPEASNFVENLRTVKSLMGKYGHPKDIWLTEQGWSTATQCTEEEQANWIIRQNIQSLSEGVRLHITFFGVDTFEEGFDRTGGYGLLYNLSQKQWGAEQISPKPAYIAFGVMTRELFRSRYIGSLDYLGPSMYAYVFEKEGKPVIVAWSSSGKKTLGLDVGAAQVRVVDIMGNAVVKKTDKGRVRLTVNQSPVYLHGASEKMFLEKRSPFISFSPEILELFPGDSGGYTIVLTNPFPGSFSAEMMFEVPEGFEGSIVKRKVVLEKGGKKSFSFRLKSSVNAEYCVYPVYFKLFREGRLFASNVMKAEIKDPVEGVIGVDFDRKYSPELSVTVTNRKSRSETVRVRFISPAGWDVRPGEHRLNLSASETGSVIFKLDKGSVDSAREYDTVVKITDTQGVGGSIFGRVNFSPCLKAKKVIIVDGSLKEWDKKVSVVLREKNQVLKKGQHLWKGPGDLSAKIYTAWDEENFYFAAEVKDDIFHQKKTGFETWQEDSIQLAVDPDQEASFVPVLGWGKQNYEYDIALTSCGSEVYRTISGDTKKYPIGLVPSRDIALSVVRKGDETVYEVAIPWEMMSKKNPVAGDGIGISAAVCDMDEDGSWEEGLKHILWFDGIVEGKQPEKFGRLVLCE